MDYLFCGIYISGNSQVGVLEYDSYHCYNVIIYLRVSDSIQDIVLDNVRDIIMVYIYSVPFRNNTF